MCGVAAHGVRTPGTARLSLVHSLRSAEEHLRRRSSLLANGHLVVHTGVDLEVPRFGGQVTAEVCLPFERERWTWRSGRSRVLRDAVPACLTAGGGPGEGYGGREVFQWTLWITPRTGVCTGSPSDLRIRDCQLPERRSTTVETGVDGRFRGTAGYLHRSGRPSAGHCEQNSQTERPAAGQQDRRCGAAHAAAPIRPASKSTGDR